MACISQAIGSKDQIFAPVKYLAGMIISAMTYNLSTGTLYTYLLTNSLTHTYTQSLLFSCKIMTTRHFRDFITACILLSYFKMTQLTSNATTLSLSVLIMRMMTIMIIIITIIITVVIFITILLSSFLEQTHTMT